jgi:hypothetical protein
MRLAGLILLIGASAILGGLAALAGLASPKARRFFHRRRVATLSWAHAFGTGYGGDEYAMAHLEALPDSIELLEELVAARKSSTSIINPHKLALDILRAAKG